MPKFKMHLSGMSLNRSYDDISSLIVLSKRKDSLRVSHWRASSTCSCKTDQKKPNCSNGLTFHGMKKVTSDLSEFEIEVLHLNHQNQDEPHHEEMHMRATTSNNERADTSPASSHQAAAGVSSQCNFANLPNVVMNQIFSYLDLKDLCRMSRVCKQWQAAARNPGIWKVVQQTPSDCEQLMMFLKSYIGKSLAFLRPFSMTTAGLQYIKQTSCHIQALWLVDIELQSLDLTNLPSSLVSLALVPSSETHHPDGEWWTVLNISRFPKLDFLFLSRTASSDDVLKQVSQLTTLTGLRFEECRKSILEATFVELTSKLTNLKFLSLTGCDGVQIQYLDYIGRHLKSLHQLRLNRVWTSNAEQDLACLTSLPELKILHIQNGIDSNTASVASFSGSFTSTITMFSKLDMLVLTDLAMHEAVLNYKTADGISTQRSCIQVQFEKLLEKESYWVRVIFSDD